MATRFKEKNGAFIAVCLEHQEIYRMYDRMFTLHFLMFPVYDAISSIQRRLKGMLRNSHPIPTNAETESTWLTAMIADIPGFSNYAKCLPGVYKRQNIDLPVLQRTALK